MKKLKLAGLWLATALAFMLVNADLAFGQSLLPNGQQQFADANGAPLAYGKVYFYAPGTTTAKTTYKDINETIPNTNPVVLNAAGRATIWGSGQYREIVYDADDNLVWDQITLGIDTSSSDSGGTTTVVNGGYGPQTSLGIGGTTDLGTVSSHNVLLTGTGTITSFGSSASTDYPVYLIQFASAGSILTYNSSSMILPGNTNITTAAGDSALAVYMGSGNWKVIQYSTGSASTTPTLHMDIITTSSVWTTPSATSASTVFKITAIGGGGAGGTNGVFNTSHYAPAGGGGSGGAGTGYYYGFAAGSSLEIVIGAGGAHGSSAHIPYDGDDTTVSYNDVALITAAGGDASSYLSTLPAYTYYGGLPGAVTFAEDTGDYIYLQSSVTNGAQAGGNAPMTSFTTEYGNGVLPYVIGGSGGGNAFGTGGSESTIGSNVTTTSPTYGGGGYGAQGGASLIYGQSGADGVVIIEWVQ